MPSTGDSCRPPARSLPARMSPYAHPTAKRSGAPRDRAGLPRLRADASVLQHQRLDALRPARWRSESPTGEPNYAPYTALRLHAMQGREAEASAAITSAIEQSASEEDGMAAPWAHLAAA